MTGLGGGSNWLIVPVVLPGTASLPTGVRLTLSHVGWELNAPDAVVPVTVVPPQVKPPRMDKLPTYGNGVADICAESGPVP